jgi:membrane protein required for colicin V production
MYWLDTTILVLLGLAALLGAISGLLWQLLRIVGFGVALYLAIFGNEWASGVIGQNILRDANPTVVKGVAYVAVFVVVYLVLFLVTFIVERAVRAAKLKFVDRLLGALFGTAKAALILGAIFLGLASVPHEPTQEVLKRSAVAPVLANGVSLILAAIPEDYKRQFNDGLQKLGEAATHKTDEHPPTSEGSKP